MLENNLASRTLPATPVHGLIWFYVVWVGLAVISAWLGHSQISVTSALFLLGGITSTNFFFLAFSRSESRSLTFLHWLTIYQTAIAIGWISAYFYFSRGSGDLALGMYITVLMVAVFYLGTRTLLKLGFIALASYVLVITLQMLVPSQEATSLLSESIRFLIFSAIVGWIYLFARQLRDLRYKLHNRI
jgi:hypothetical protein